MVSYLDGFLFFDTAYHAYLLRDNDTETKSPLDYLALLQEGKAGALSLLVLDRRAVPTLPN